MPPKASLVVLAAGRGVRFGGGTNKVLRPLLGKPLLLWALEPFLSLPGIGEAVVVARPGEESEVASLVGELSGDVRVVAGGERRQDSSLAGVRAARGEIVLIHDAARPLVGRDLILRVLQEAERWGAAVPGVPVRDTIRYGTDGFWEARDVPRRGLYRVQTPQGFRRELILRALEETQDLELTDDGAAVLHLGERVALVPGDPWNLKVTYPDDLKLAELVLRAREAGG